MSEWTAAARVAGVQVLKPLAVTLAGVGLAFVLAVAAAYAVFAGYGYPVVDWPPVEATHMVLAVVAALLVHLLWVVTWCVWRGLGWARFVAAVLLLPVTGLLVWDTVAVSWAVSTRGNGWSWGSELFTQEPAGRISVFVPVILVPAVVVAVSVLVIARVPARDPEESMFVRPAWVPRTLLRGSAITAAALGCLVLASLLVFLLMAMAGLV